MKRKADIEGKCKECNRKENYIIELRKKKNFTFQNLMWQKEKYADLMALIAEYENNCSCGAISSLITKHNDRIRHEEDVKSAIKTGQFPRISLTKEDDPDDPEFWGQVGTIADEVGGLHDAFRDSVLNQERLRNKYEEEKRNFIRVGDPGAPRSFFTTPGIPLIERVPIIQPRPYYPPLVFPDDE